MANPVVCMLSNNGSGYLVGGSGEQYSEINFLDLVKREDVWRSAIFRDMNTQQPFASPTYAKYEGNAMRSQILKVQIVNNRADKSILRSVSIGFTPSEVSFQ